MRYLAALIITVSLQQTSLYAYSVLAHEAIIDTVWKDSMQPLLLQKFPQATEENLKMARAYTYGGSIIQDMGYYPFGSHFYTDLVHYVRSGDFVAAMLRNAQTLNEYAFALGALAHYAADTNGHSIGINRAVPLLYPKLKRKFGDEVTFSDDSGSHLKTEFGFDVLQVATGRYLSDQYHDFIGFEVSQPLLERAFREIYGLELKDVSGSLDLAISTYRKAVSDVIPKMTNVAWVMKKDEIEKSQPGITQQKFRYTLLRADYEKSWGKDYRRPGSGSRFLAFIIRIVPKIGPLKSLSFRTPTPETEKLFLASFDATVETYRKLLAEEKQRQVTLNDVNLDVGRPTAAGQYKLADETYAKLVGELAEHRFAGVPGQLKDDILNFYKNQSSDTTPARPAKHSKRQEKLQGQLEMLKATASYSQP
jgi:zinc dependent phospholipase C